jgi:hypothetical protein
MFTISKLKHAEPCERNASDLCSGGRCLNPDRHSDRPFVVFLSLCGQMSIASFHTLLN